MGDHDLSPVCLFSVQRVQGSNSAVASQFPSHGSIPRCPRLVRIEKSMSECQGIELQVLSLGGFLIPASRSSFFCSFLAYHMLKRHRDTGGSKQSGGFVLNSGLATRLSPRVITEKQHSNAKSSRRNARECYLWKAWRKS